MFETCFCIFSAEVDIWFCLVEVRCDLNAKRLAELDMDQKTTDGKPVPAENSGWDECFS